ncbi:MAG: ComEA family DNA-binding protein [Thermoleophilaceae bacterium]
MLDASRGTVLTWVVAAVLATLAAVRLLGGGGPEPPPLRIDGEAAGTTGPPGAGRSGRGAGGAGGQDIFVHVAGAVRRPGLYRVPSAARVAEALERAGGPLRRAELTAVNLAARMEDGQQVVVPAAGAVPVAVAAGARASPGTAGAVPGAAGAVPGTAGVKLSLAAATVDQLDELDGIGPTLAGRIIEYRDAHGGFRSVEQLREVDGIGEKRFATLREAVQP